MNSGSPLATIMSLTEFGKSPSWLYIGFANISNCKHEQHDFPAMSSINFKIKSENHFHLTTNKLHPAGIMRTPDLQPSKIKKGCALGRRTNDDNYLLIIIITAYIMTPHFPCCVHIFFAARILREVEDCIDCHGHCP